MDKNSLTHLLVMFPKPQIWVGSCDLLGQERVGKVSWCNFSCKVTKALVFQKTPLVFQKTDRILSHRTRSPSCTQMEVPYLLWGTQATRRGCGHVTFWEAKEHQGTRCVSEEAVLGGSSCSSQPTADATRAETDHQVKTFQNSWLPKLWRK